jgi:hypothetical protein
VDGFQMENSKKLSSKIAFFIFFFKTSFWVQILDRLQMHLAFVLIPSEFFKLDSFNDDIDMQTNDDKVLVLIEQHSDMWINVII